MKKQILVILLITFQINFAQNESFFKRLSALEQDDTTFYNVDGYSIVSHKTFLKFNDKNLKEEYLKNKVKEKDKKNDDNLNFRNYKFTILKDTRTSVKYFVENKDKNISVFVFQYDDITDTQLERKMIGLILNDEIPRTCFSLKIEKFNFAGRSIELGGYLELVGNCNWSMVNNIQCSGYGQMDWSVHKTKKSADVTIEKRLIDIKQKGEIISEKNVQVVFEGVKTNAKKVYIKFTGFKSYLGPNLRLNIYLISEKVRNNYVSCVLSFYDTDNINLSGLPNLLEKVMSIKKK